MNPVEFEQLIKSQAELKPQPNDQFEVLSLTKDEFISKAKAMLGSIIDHYSKCWGNSHPYDSEEDQSEERKFDSDEFLEFMEQAIFESNTYLELLYCEISQ